MMKDELNTFLLCLGNLQCLIQNTLEIVGQDSLAQTKGKRTGKGWEVDDQGMGVVGLEGSHQVPKPVHF